MSGIAIVVGKTCKFIDICMGKNNLNVGRMRQN